MKKTMIILLICVLLIGLCACSGQQQDPTNVTNGTENTTVESTETQTTETQSAKDPKALAESCIDKPVADLYALIGEPNSSDYAPSCMGDGEDGNLYYDGFTVYTYREGDEESVHYVE